LHLSQPGIEQRPARPSPCWHKRITQAQHPAPTTGDYLAQLAQVSSADDRRQLANVRRMELGTA
jgi:hypothetical protein